MHEVQCMLCAHTTSLVYYMHIDVMIQQREWTLSD